MPTRTRSQKIGRPGTHLRTNTTEFNIWSGMRARCTNPTNKSYHCYGGRGITICDEWRNSFETFFRDMGERPAGMSLDRIDNDGNYEPSNCRWATSKEQSLNKRITRSVIFRGQLTTVKEYCEATGATYTLVLRRLDKGWPVDLALTAPVGTRYTPSPKAMARPDGRNRLVFTVRTQKQAASVAWSRRMKFTPIKFLAQFPDGVVELEGKAFEWNGIQFVVHRRRPLYDFPGEPLCVSSAETGFGCGLITAKKDYANAARQAIATFEKKGVDGVARRHRKG